MSEVSGINSWFVLLVRDVDLTKDLLFGYSKVKMVGERNYMLTAIIINHFINAPCEHTPIAIDAAFLFWMR